MNFQKISNCEQMSLGQMNLSRGMNDCSEYDITMEFRNSKRLMKLW